MARLKANKKRTVRKGKKTCVKILEDEILKNLELHGDTLTVSKEEPHEVVDPSKLSLTVSKEEPHEVVDPSNHRDMLEQIMFKLPCVLTPLIGTPQQVQKELDGLALKLAKKMKKGDSDTDKIFDKIHLYMHGYLINVVLKKFPFIRGLQSVDIYQETLIALQIKAIPNFRRNKGMSFLNFAKMCIRRHLITLLNASKNRKKDQSINQAISLDSSPIKRDDEDEFRTTYANIIADNKEAVDKTIEKNEAYEVTKKNLLGALSDFERIVLSEYLSSSSYKEISKNITVVLKKRCDTKSVDNALLRIKKKAIHLMKYGKPEDLPIFMPKST